MRICILGAGTYGSYAVNSIQERYPDAKIYVFDVGNNNIKNETDIGFLSKLKKSDYKGLTHGRYFGWGGASHKWGGQLLTYTNNDFANPNKFMQDVINLDNKYKNEFLAKFNIENKYPENQISHSLFTKTGVWLSMLHRNFFHWFKVNKRQNVTVYSNCRVVKLLSDDKKKIDGIIYLENGIEKKASFDYYFLTSGAFENARIMLSSDLTNGNKVMFSDHLSQKIFKVKKSTKIGDEDFVFRMRGTSLITKRMVGEVNDISYYVHPVFNLNFPFFEMIKDIFFYHNFSLKNIGSYLKTTILDIPKVLGFVWCVLVLRKMYVLNKEWFLYIDIENPTYDSFVSLSKEKDKFGVEGLDVCYNVGEQTSSVFKHARNEVIKHMKLCDVDFDIVSEKIDIHTCEDIYHPYAMFDFESMDDYYSRWSNMLIVTTGILPRSGGINPTGAILPLVDEFVNKYLQIKIMNNQVKLNKKHKKTTLVKNVV